jgi:hypothetical protein
MTWLLAIGALVAWIAFKAGLKIGGVEAVKLVVEGFTLDCHADDKDQGMTEVASKLRQERSWFRNLGRPNSKALTEIRWIEIGAALAHVGIARGMEMETGSNRPEPDETSVVMRKKELADIAWLAGYGLLVWIKPSDDLSGVRIVRHGERLDKERAERLANSLDTFERKIPKLFTETEHEKEARFNNYEGRMKDIWAAYGF